MSLFDESVAEITPSEGNRYVLRRNPHRAQEIAAAREDKYQTLRSAVAASNAYLATHRRAHPTLALEKLRRRAKQLQIHAWTTLTLEQRTLTLEKNTPALTESAKLDGCYVLKTDLPPLTASKELVHERYKDLALVEWAFRESKTVHLEMIYVRLESRTRGHALVVMLAYLLIHTLAQPLASSRSHCARRSRSTRHSVPDRSAAPESTPRLPAPHPTCFRSATPRCRARAFAHQNRSPRHCCNH